MRRHRSKKEPARPHPSQRPGRLDSRGHVMTPEEQRKEWSRCGLCTNCGIIQISRKVSLFGMKREVLTIPGKVYKGICLQCNTLQYAQEQLGETAAVIDRGHRRQSTVPSAAAGSNYDDTARRAYTRGASLEEETRTLKQQGVPQNVGPRMGGLQKQVSDITLDSTMRDLDIDPQKSHSERNFNSLDDIVEDESSHDKDIPRVPASTGNIESRLGAFPSEGGAMQRLEDKIRAKSDAAAAETSSHVHFSSLYSHRGEYDERVDEEHASVKKTSKLGGHNASSSPSGGGMSSQHHDILGRLKTDDSGAQDSMPGTAVNMTADRLNIYEERIRRKNAQSLHSKPLAAAAKNAIQTDIMSLSQHSSESDSDKAKGRDHHGLNRMKTDASGAQDSLPGIALDMTGDRLNIFEQRIRRKNAQSPTKGSSSTERNASKSDIISVSDHDEYSDKVDRVLQRVKTEGSDSHDNSPSTPGTAVSVTGDRLNVYEQRICRKNDKFHQSLTEQPTQERLKLSMHAASARALPSVTESDSKPGVVNMHGDLLNLYERRINQKTKQYRQAEHKRLENADEKSGVSNSDNSEKSQVDSSFQRLVSNESGVSGSLPGTAVSMAGDRLNLFERRLYEKNQRNQAVTSKLEDNQEAQNDETSEEHKSATALSLFERRLYEKNKQDQVVTSKLEENREARNNEMSEVLKSAPVSHDSSSSDKNEPGAFPDSGRVNVFDQIMRDKKASSDGSDTRYSKILERKLHGEKKGAASHKQSQTDAVECAGVLDAKAQICEIMKSRSCDDMIGFLRLHSNSLSPEIIAFAFGCIREMVTKHYVVISDRPHLFRSKVSWLKLFSSIMYAHFSNELIQTEALKTLWSVATYSSRHAIDIIANDEIVESIVDCMEAHQSEDVNEFGSGLISCLASSMSESDTLSLMDRCDGQIVQRLVAALTSTSCSGVSHLNAIRALGRLSTVFHLTCDGYFGDLMGREIQDERVGGCSSAKAVCAVLDSMRQHSNLALLQNEGCRLLCQIFARDAIIDDELFFAVTDGILNHIESISPHQRSFILDEALIYLLCYISSYSSDTVDDTFSFSKVVVEIMAKYPDSASIALQGCRFIYNVCSGESNNRTRSSIGSSGGIDVMLKYIFTFERDIELVGEACGALFACCCDCPSNKTHVLNLGGIEKISAHAFNESLDSEDEDVLSLNMRACCALITLAVDPSALQEMQNLGIIETFSSWMKDESMKIRDSLRYKMQELVSISLNNDDEVSFESGMSEDGIHEYLYVNLKAIVTNQLDNKTTLVLQANTISSMRKFPNSEAVQEMGCKILACMFGRGRSGSVNSMEAVVRCINSSNAAVVAAAASACRNFCSVQTIADLDSYEAERFLNILLHSIDGLVNALQDHKNDEAAVEQVVSALWAITTMGNGAIHSLESTGFINQILDLLDRSLNIQWGCIGLLHAFFNSTEKTMDYLNDNLILAVIKCLQSDDENVATIAIGTTFAITETGAFPARMMILNNHHELLIGAIVECMFKFPTSTTVIRAACDIFTNISLDNYYRSAICSMGGTGRINESLERFVTDELTVSKALISLTNVISGCDVEVLRLTNVSNNVLGAMARYTEDLFVQIHGAAAIWHLASRDDIFKDILVNSGAVQYLSDAMARFIASEQMTRKGIVALWSLSVPKHLKVRVVQGGLASVVNGMSAHVLSEKVCEEGLGALKSLSTVDTEIVDSNDALDLIYSCMWLHSHNSGIQQASLAALVNLSVDMEKNQVLRISFEDLETIVEVMRIHQSTKAVQENAIILLRNFTFSPHNCRILQENSYLTGLIRVAMTNHHDTFQGRAEDLLRVLPPDSQ